MKYVHISYCMTRQLWYVSCCYLPYTYTSALLFVWLVYRMLMMRKAFSLFLWPLTGGLLKVSRYFFANDATTFLQNPIDNHSHKLVLKFSKFCDRQHDTKLLRRRKIERGPLRTCRVHRRHLHRGYLATPIFCLTPRQCSALYLSPS